MDEKGELDIEASPAEDSVSEAPESKEEGKLEDAEASEPAEDAEPVEEKVPQTVLEAEEEAEMAEQKSVKTGKKKAAPKTTPEEGVAD